ncbi:glycosyltransferase family 4 protein [Larkinella terrae]|uniref:Glycosyltransferase n=2 Tax=Larkinella terrae TaxID=2025311 RepID=A0A7K0EE26_9BACT|nr:glycosyltransferase [Larkinella terrae]
MHVCFMMAGLPHYFTLVLNKLATDYSIEVSIIKPNKRSKSIGSGVHEETGNNRFQILDLEEYTTWYGKPFFKDIQSVLLEKKPDLLVVSWPYILHFAMSRSFWQWTRRQEIRLIYRDIPFNVPEWGKVREFYYGVGNQNEDFSLTRKKTLSGYLNTLALTLMRRIYMHRADAHVYYVDDAYQIAGSYGIPREKIFITANSPDTDELLAAFEQVQREEPVLPPNPYRLIHVGRLVKWKRVDLIIETVKRLQTSYPDIELLVVGYGPEEENWKKLAVDEGVESRVKFVGGVYDSVSLGRFLHASAIYVLGGMGGLSINDAMCFAKPVVCSVADGTEKRLVREGYNGGYFENGNADSLTEKIDNLLADPQRVKTFGEHSLQIIRNEVNIHTVLKEYVRAFEYVVGIKIRTTPKSPEGDLDAANPDAKSPLQGI